MSEVNMVQQLFKQYKVITEDMVVKFNKHVNIDGMLTDRKKILEKISEISIPGNAKKDIYMSLGIDKIDEELGKIINDSAMSIKEEIKINNLRRQTTNSYNKAFMQNNLFSRRV